METDICPLAVIEPGTMAIGADFKHRHAVGIHIQLDLSIIGG
jgi:hypothetical protein